MWKMKNQPGTMKNHKTDLEPWQTNLEPWKPMKNNLEQWKTMKNHEQSWKTNLEPWKPWKINLEPWKTMKTYPEPWKNNLGRNNGKTSLTRGYNWPFRYLDLDQHWLFCRECTQFLVYFLQVQIMWRCTKSDRYEVCLSRALAAQSETLRKPENVPGQTLFWPDDPV